jgi:competence protein ComK
MLVHEINAIYYDSRIKQSKILTNQIDCIDIKPKDVIESLCNRYGLSLDGSLSAIKRSLNIHQKCPVLVHPLLQIYFFPTCSMNEVDCVWINSKQIKKINKKDYVTEVVFRNNTSILCNVGNRSIKKQISRCEMMEDLILKQYQIDQLSLKV